MPYPFYKLLHFASIFLLLGTLGASCALGIVQFAREGSPHRKVLGILHGTSVLFILVSGFGLLARLGFIHDTFPTWAVWKLAIWVLLAASIALPGRGRRAAMLVLALAPVLAVTAAYFGFLKPMM